MIAFKFQEKAGETLEDKALRVCEVIVSAGLGIRGGKICAGGNNVMANNAIKSFVFDDQSRNDGMELRSKMEDGRACIFSMAQDVITMMQHAVMNDSDQSRAHAVMYLTNMKKFGWQANVKPNNFDVNAAGAKLYGYEEPEGAALEFAKAFRMLPKSSPNYQPRPGVK